MPASPTDRAESGSSRVSPRRQGASTGTANHGSIDRCLGDLLPRIEQALQDACQLGDDCPPRLADAIRYAVLAPGKRLRPALVLMAAQACGESIDTAMPGAVAVEMIHAYSLIHDDLPAMDDDDLRRGRPTVHIQFDEATAILAGDALQPMAFAHLCRECPNPEIAAEAVKVLSSAAGPEHLVGGQADDLAAESGQLPDEIAQAVAACHGTDAGPDGRAAAETADGEQADDPERSLEGSTHDHVGKALGFLESIHRRKTGALFSASLELGAVLSRASEANRAALSAYASDLGLAFQVVDDLLDHTAQESEIGKRVGKDSERGKLTYPGLMGLERAKSFAADLVTSAKGHTSVFGDAAWRLIELADYVLERSR